MFSNPTLQRNLAIDHSVSDEGTPILVWSGHINLKNANVFSFVVKSLSRQNKLGLAGLSGADAVDSSGLGSILGTYISAKSDNCELRLVNVHPRVKDLLNLTRLSSVSEGR